LTLPRLLLRFLDTMRVRLPGRREVIFVLGLFAGLARLSAADPASPAPVATVAPAYSEKQYAALQAAVSAECAASAALAGEDFAAWNHARPNLSKALAGLPENFTNAEFSDAVKQAQLAWPALEKAADFPHARSAFVPVSDAFAQVALAAGQHDARLAKVVIYYCPMTSHPSNGRWVQAAAPLRNPFWGKDMLDCGAEVKR
jgi:hypothetical protein